MGVIYFLRVYLTVVMAAMNLILGVVVDAAYRAKQSLEDEYNAERALVQLQKNHQLVAFFHELDADKTGDVSREEVQATMKQPGPVQDLFQHLSIEEDDFDIVWQLMDPNKTGRASYKNVVTNLCNLRSSNPQFMLTYIKSYVTSVKQGVIDELKKLVR